MRQSPTSITTSKILVGPPWSVEIAAGRDIENASAYGEVDGLAVRAVERLKCRWCEGSKYGWCWGGREHCGFLRSQLGVECKDEETEQDKVYGCCYGLAAELVSFRVRRGGVEE